MLSVDPDAYIPVDVRRTLELQLRSIVFAQIVVVIIDSMSRAFIGVDSIQSAIERFARQVMDQCGIGDSVLQNGILVVLSVGDRYIHIRIIPPFAAICST